MAKNATQDTALPSFERPPVAEVVMGVQFANPAPLNTFDFLSLWEKFGKKNFPRYEEVPPLGLLEPFAENQMMKLEFSQMPGVPRYWFLGKNDDELIQVQRNRFIYNWRRPNEEDDKSYPRYGHVKENFFKNFDVFGKFLSTKSMPMSPSVSELVYINHIPLNDNNTKPESIFTNICYPDDTDLFNNAIAVHHAVGFAGPEKNMRSSVQINTMQNMQTGTRALKLEITVHAVLADSRVEALEKTFDTSREWIVKAFAALTTPEMHKVWGRQK